MNIAANSWAAYSNVTSIYYTTTANSTAATTYYWPPSSGGGTGSSLISADEIDLVDFVSIGSGRLKVPQGRELVIEFADGSSVHVDAAGNYRLEDAAAKVIYKASRMREFNPYLNASDLLARFIRDIGAMGVKRGEVAMLPIALFVNWLVIEAARMDEDPVPADVVPVPEHRLLKARVHPRCLTCQRFIPRVHAAGGFQFCSPDHAARHFARLTSGRAA